MQGQDGFEGDVSRSPAWLGWLLPAVVGAGLVWAAVAAYLNG